MSTVTVQNGSVTRTKFKGILLELVKAYRIPIINS